MRIANDLIIDAASMTGTETINSAPIWLGHAGLVTVQAVWTGTPNGTLKLQCSVDHQEPRVGVTPDPQNWEDVADSEYAVEGAAGSYTWNVSDVGFPWMKVVYVNTSSTGTLSARFNSKGF